MAERRRFLIGPADVGETVFLSASESRHAVRVLRLRAGRQIEAVDGSGAEYLLELRGGAAGKAVAVVLEKHLAQPARAIEVTVAMGVVKGARMDWAVEKAAELGARSFVPVFCERSVVPPESGRLKTQRWRRVAAAALKQSLAPYLMDVLSPHPLDYLIDLASEVDLVFLADPQAPALRPPRRLKSGNSSCLLLVGPEGGFSEPESGRLKAAGAIGFSLGPSRLRSETAVVAGLATLWAASGMRVGR